MTDVDAARFLQAPLITRAVLILQRAFRDPMEPVSRLNVALAIANQAPGGPSGVVGGVLAGSRSADPKVLRSVSEAWQILESARLVCVDLTDPAGDWWLLTGAGIHARDSPDPEGEIGLRIVGGP
jgi:hypothetical protein